MPAPAVVIELLKPITWFPPMWAFGCGVISSGVPAQGHWSRIIAGVLLCGPLLCASSQAVNDWFDRHVDSINEPNRPIPSGRMPGRWGLYVAIIWTLLSLVCAAALGRWVFGAASIGLSLAWAYSAPPIRLKRNGWWGNLACAVCYEGFAWVTGAAIMAGGVSPSNEILLVALLYSLGAHGIMTLNDFKSIDGDRRCGIGSLPVRLGAEHAGEVACVAMALPQLAVVALLIAWGQTYAACAVGGLLGAQLLLMRRLLVDPRAKAPWYNGTGVSLYVLGMLVVAFALRGIGQ
ncbi:MAG: chlorophyll synthase ChlG [Pseudomonadota bacterium]|nr:chlorophyll synthase ChlG [Pseudomonadota bacterium]